MISIVLPIHNEEEVLPTLFERLNDAASTWEDDYEILCVDDGSTDRSKAFLDKFHQLDPRWKTLSLSRNFGHQTAVSAGLYYSSGDAVVVMDADLQDPPEELHRFLDKWREGYDVVYAVRTKRKENIFKRAAYALFYRLMHQVASIDIPLDSGDFCVMDKRVVDVLRTMPERARFVRGLRSWSGFRQIGVKYERSARYAGDVKYTFRKLVRLAFDGIFSFSNTPLKLASWMGVMLCGGSFGLLALLLVWWASDVSLLGMNPGNVVGWTSLCSLILLLSGVQMLFVGVIGEYLARVFDEVKQRPPWVIAHAVGMENNHSQPLVGWHVPEETTAPKVHPIAKPMARAG